MVKREPANGGTGIPEPVRHGAWHVAIVLEIYGP